MKLNIWIKRADRLILWGIGLLWAEAAVVLNLLIFMAGGFGQ